MTSRASSPSSETDGESLQSRKRYRKETVYDAVAGRIAASGFISKHPVISSTRDTASSTTVALAPETVLFRRKNAPTRFAEDDIYFAKERELRTDLPESELLKALHTYTSDFFTRATPDAGHKDLRSMDETALIAMGILMEELSRETLGATGDLVFTEGEEVNMSSNSFPLTIAMVSEVKDKNTEGRPSKKRRVAESAKTSFGSP